MATDPNTTSRQLPFRLRGVDGIVDLTHGINADPERWGFEMLALPFELEQVRGFPWVSAVVRYPGEGYHALMGWIQVVTVTPQGISEPSAAVDVYPIHWALDTPFVTFGQAPTLFDAPGLNPPRTDELWVAETFLAVTPDGCRKRHIVPVLGFRWGYTLAHSHATLLPLEVVVTSDWMRCRAILQRDYPAWEYAAAWLEP